MTNTAPIVGHASQSGIVLSAYSGNNGPGTSTMVATATSGLDGWFLLVLPPGAYTIRQTLPATLQQTTPANNFGQHVVSVAGVPTVANISGQPIAFENFPVAQPMPIPAPLPVSPAQPTGTPVTGVIGWNIGDAPNSDTAVAGLKHFTPSGQQPVARYFCWGPPTQAAVTAWLKPATDYKARGAASVCAINFQTLNSGKCLTQDAWTNYLNLIPAASQTGIIVFEIGNEINTSTYFTDTPANYAAAFKVASAILRGKGYKVIVGNVTNWGKGSSGQNLYEALAALGVFVVADGAGLHAYDGDFATAQAAYIAFLAWLAPLGVMAWITELGLHGGDLAAWATEFGKLLTWAMKQAGYWIVFPLFVTKTKAGPQGVFNAQGQPNQPFYGAAEAGMK